MQLCEIMHVCAWVYVYEGVYQGNTVVHLPHFIYLLRANYLGIYLSIPFVYLVPWGSIWVEHRKTKIVLASGYQHS